MISVLSSSPVSRRNSNSLPIWASVWDRKPAYTSISRVARRRASGESDLPLGHVGIVPRQFGVGRNDPQLLLAGEHLPAVGIPALVEAPRVPVGPLLRHMVRCVRRAGAEMQEERLVRGHLLGVGDEGDGVIGQVLGQVIALRRATRRLHLVVVVDQLGIPLAGVAAQEPVEAVETAPERPPVVGPGGGLLLGRHQMPLADHVGVVAVLLQHLRQETVLERDVAVITRIAGRQLGDRRHPVGVVVAAGDHARARRRTQRRGVHAVVAQPAGRERVQMRRGDRTPVTAELPEPGVVQNNEQHVGRSGNRPHRLRPRRRRLVGGPARPGPGRSCPADTR